jgi:hypothetical protein
LYGPKKLLRTWFEKFSEALMDFGLHQCQTDQKVFHLHIIVGYIILVVYVNGIVIAGSDFGRIIRLKQFLQQRFHIKDLDKLQYFLGIEVERSKIDIKLISKEVYMYLTSSRKKMGC